VQFTIPAALWQQVRLIRGSKFGTFSLETRVSRCNFVACRLDPSGGWVKNYKDSRCLASWTTRSGRNFWSVKLSTLNPKTKIVFTARADNLLHLHSTIITIHRFQSICFKCNLSSPSSVCEKEIYFQLAISFRIVHRGVHELAALQLQITDTLWLWWKHHDFWSCAMLYKLNASMHLLVKKLRERVSLTFTDPKMHYCCWAFKCAEFRCS
jgi:hypothetical protein